MKRILVSVTLAMVFVLALAMPAFALTSVAFMEHNTTYDIDGNVHYFYRQAGQGQVTGAVYLQQIRGEGKMQKFSHIDMVPFRLTVEDDNDFVTAPGAVVNLKVTSTINLTAPPAYTYLDAHVDYSAMYLTGIPQPAIWTYNTTTGDYEQIGENFGAPTGQAWEPVGHGRARVGYEPGVQRWAVEVEAYAGYSGRITQEFDAAYAPFNHASMSWNHDPVWIWNSPRGFVGDYFVIDQFARTSQGDLRRFIDISSPWSGAYLHEDMRVTGYSEIREDFEMMNLLPGQRPAPDGVTPIWHNLFL